MEAKKNIIIVGAGTGGTALAARLAYQGHKVTVYEKNSYHGGRCSLINQNGYRFDQGPSLLLMKEIFEETFTDLGTSLSSHVELLKCTKNYNLYFHDGRKLELSSDLPLLIEELKKFEKDDSFVGRFLGFLKESESHYRHSVAFALRENYNSFWSMFQLKVVLVAFKIHLWDTVYGRASKYFRSDYLRQAFTFQTMYLGMSPYEAPGALNLLQFAEIGGGIWYPLGGFNKIIEALEQIAKSHGATFHYDSPVTKVDVNESKDVIGVTVESEFKEADIVVVNADLVYAYNKLLPPTAYSRSLAEDCSFTSSSISFYWSMKTIIPELTVHNIFLAEDFKASFDEIFKHHTLPSQPSFYVNVPSRIDSTAAPNGKDSIIVLVPIGHMQGNNERHLDDLITLARDYVIQTLECRLGITGFRDFIHHEEVNDPRTWEKKFNLWKGSVLGLNHNITQMLCFRPRIQSPEFRNLYFVGASAHPGTGVPIVLYGARLAAEKIQADLRLKTAMVKRCSYSYMTIYNLFLLMIIVLAVIFRVLYYW